VLHVGSMDLEEESLDGFVNRPLIPQRYGVLLNYEQKLYLRRCHVTCFVKKKVNEVRSIGYVLSRASSGAPLRIDVRLQ
jgi:hypothetical protein